MCDLYDDLCDFIWWWRRLWRLLRIVTQGKIPQSVPESVALRGMSRRWWRRQWHRRPRGLQDQEVIKMALHWETAISLLLCVPAHRASCLSGVNMRSWRFGLKKGLSDVNWPNPAQIRQVLKKVIWALRMNTRIGVSSARAVGI